MTARRASMTTFTTTSSASLHQVSAAPPVCCHSERYPARNLGCVWPPRSLGVPRDDIMCDRANWNGLRDQRPAPGTSRPATGPGRLTCSARYRMGNARGSPPRVVNRSSSCRWDRPSPHSYFFGFGSFLAGLGSDLGSDFDALLSAGFDSVLVSALASPVVSLLVSLLLSAPPLESAFAWSV